MKKLLMLAAAAAAILPMTAQATVNSAQGVITLTANSNNTCAIRAIIRGRDGAGTYTPSSNTTVNNLVDVTASLNFGDLLMNQTNANTNASAANSGHDFYLRAFCNYAGHTVSLKSANGGLINTTGPQIAAGSTFNKRIPYQAEIRDWNSGPFAVLNATGAGADGSLTNADVRTVTASSLITEKAVNNDNSSIRITTAANSTPLLAGTFSDTLTVRLGSAFPAPPASTTP